MRRLHRAGRAKKVPTQVGDGGGDGANDAKEDTIVGVHGVRVVCEAVEWRVRGSVYMLTRGESAHA